MKYIYLYMIKYVSLNGKWHLPLNEIRVNITLLPMHLNMHAIYFLLKDLNCEAKLDRQDDSEVSATQARCNSFKISCGDTGSRLLIYIYIYSLHVSKLFSYFYWIKWNTIYLKFSVWLRIEYNSVEYNISVYIYIYGSRWKAPEH